MTDIAHIAEKNCSLQGFHHVEAVVEENGGFFETRRHATAIEQDEVEGRAIASGNGGQTIASLTGEACLDAEAAFVGSEQSIGITAGHVAPID